MSKSVLGVGLALVAFAIPVVGPMIGLSVLASTAITAGVAIAGNVLLGPSMPKMPSSLADGGISRLHANLDPTTPRKFVFGNTAMATDVRYQTFTGTGQAYLEQIVCVASHEVQSIDEIWLDNEKAWTLAGGIQGRYVGYLTVATRTLGTGANGIAIDSVWTTSCTLTGCAYVHLKFKLTGNSDTVQSPFASGVPSRMTIRGKGAKVYDPRLDSTVTGGSGTQRANDQTTWAWSDTASRNPALQELWYELGWKVNSKIMVGKGVPSARLDLESYITAANACDESVTLVDLTTEPRYRSDGVMSEGDDPSAVREALCATMNAILRDSGGKLALTVLVNDLATPVASFGAGDVLGAMDWKQTPEIHSIFNIVRGRRIDPGDVALYQPVDFPEVKLTSLDMIDRIYSIDFLLVQSNGQAQRLAKQRLQRNQYQGRLQLVGKPSFWQLNLGHVFDSTHSAFGWTNKLFRCASIRISRTGEAEISAVEENAAIYAWDKEEAAAVTPGAATVYDPLNNPILNPPFGTVIGANKPEDDATIDANIVGDNPVTIFADSVGTPKTGELTKSTAYRLFRLGSALTSGVTWTATLMSGNATFTITGTGSSALDITGPTDSTLSAESVVRLTATYAGVARTFDVKVIKQSDPPTTTSGGGTGGTTATTTTLANTDSTAYTETAVSATLLAKAGSNGQVACTAPLDYNRVTDTATGETGSLGKWQWRVVSGTWADITTEVADSGNAKTLYDAELDRYLNPSGSLSVPHTKTGLTNGTEYEFRFLWRRTDVAGTASEVYRSSGVLQAAGS